jgi:polyhydroxybutyrate depolymerase
MSTKARVIGTVGFGTILVTLNSGCASQVSSQVVEDNIIHDGMVRTYLLYQPAGFDPPMPVVFNLHGYGSSAKQQMMYTNMNAVADTAGFLVVYPDAVGNRWNSGISDNPRWPTRNVDDVGFFDALIDTLRRQYSVDLHQVYACGMSNGGFMSFKLACQLSHRISAVASVTGVISQSTALDCAPSRAVPILHIHGTNDPTVPYNGTFGWYSAEQTVDHWTDLHGCFRSDTTSLPDKDPFDGCTVTRIINTDSLGNADVIFFEVAGGGHTWPGAAFDLPGAGNTNRDINASEEIWRFFRDRKLPSLPSDSVGDPSTP